MSRGVWEERVELDAPDEGGSGRHGSGVGGRAGKGRPAHRQRRSRAEILQAVVMRVAWALLALSIATFLVNGVSRAPRPHLLPAENSVPSSRVSGFGEIAFEVEGPAVANNLTHLKHCALVARTTAQQEQGLMNRHDLAGYEGMVFQFDQPTTVAFYMKDTLIPLSIAWFSPGGTFINDTDMPPCKAQVSCPLYQSAAPYSTAIEVEQGYLPQLGIGPGAKLTVGGPCATN